MADILLINPNASPATTDMMVEIAMVSAKDSFRVEGRTAAAGPSMIVNEAELSAAGMELQKTWQRAGSHWAGVIVSAFGDPGIEGLRLCVDGAMPVVGICEASLLEAARGGRRFGIATVTPDLVELIQRRVDELGLTAFYTGIRLTPGSPRDLAADPAALEEKLAEAVQECIDVDGAQAVVIGGGPLAQAARQFQARFGVPIIEPIPAAVRQLKGLLAARSTA